MLGRGAACLCLIVSGVVITDHSTDGATGALHSESEKECANDEAERKQLFVVRKKDKSYSLWQDSGTELMRATYSTEHTGEVPQYSYDLTEQDWHGGWSHVGYVEPMDGVANLRGEAADESLGTKPLSAIMGGALKATAAKAMAMVTPRAKKKDGQLESPVAVEVAVEEASDSMGPMSSSAVTLGGTVHFPDHPKPKLSSTNPSANAFNVVSKEGIKLMQCFMGVTGSNRLGIDTVWLRKVDKDNEKFKGINPEMVYKLDRQFSTDSQLKSFLRAEDKKFLDDQLGVVDKAQLLSKDKFMSEKNVYVRSFSKDGHYPIGGSLLLINTIESKDQSVFRLDVDQPFDIAAAFGFAVGFVELRTGRADRTLPLFDQTLFDDFQRGASEEQNTITVAEPDTLHGMI